MRPARRSLRSLRPLLVALLAAGSGRSETLTHVAPRQDALPPGEVRILKANLGSDAGGALVRVWYGVACEVRYGWHCDDAGDGASACSHTPMDWECSDKEPVRYRLSSAFEVVPRENEIRVVLPDGSRLPVAAYSDIGSGQYVLLPRGITLRVDGAEAAVSIDPELVRKSWQEFRFRELARPAR